MIAVAAIAVLTMVAAMAPASAETVFSVNAHFAAADGGSVVGGSYVVTDAHGTIVRQGTIGDRQQAMFLNTFTSGETYTLTAVAEGYQAASQTLTITPDNARFHVTLEQLKIVKKTITIGVEKGGTSGWYLAEAPEGSTWTLTDVNSGTVYTGSFSGPVPQTIELADAVGSGTYLVQINAGPTFLPYEDTVTIRGNSGALYFVLTPDLSVVPR